MKIAFFSDCYLDLTGGITSSINAQKAALEKAGHTVYIFSTSYPKSKAVKLQLAKKNIFPVPSCRFLLRGITPISRRPHIIEKWLLQNHPEIKNFDIYYIHYEAGCSIAGLKLGKKLHISTVQVMHGREDMGVANIIPFGFRTIVATLLNWFHSWYIPHPIKVHRDNYLADTIAKAKMWTMMVNHASYADLVLTPSAHFRKKLLHYGVKKEIEVFPNGFPDAKFPKNPELKTLNKNDELKIIWHSRVSGEKRIMPLLEALRLLGDTNKAKKSPKFTLDIYGNGGDLNRAKKFVKKHKINANFHGNVPFEKLSASIMNSHLDILVSSNFDTFGMTLIEAEVYGVPVLFCDPDMKEIVPPESYILSKTDSSESIAEALNNLLDHPEKIQQMSKIMLEHRTEVLISKRIKILEKIFNGIIDL